MKETEYVIRYTDPTTGAQCYVDCHDSEGPRLGDGRFPALLYTQKEATTYAAVLRQELEAIGYKGRIDVVEQ